MTIGRNDPCPCGSGRKYKKCHLAADSARGASEQHDSVSPLHELDNRLVEDLLQYGARRFGSEFLETIEKLDSIDLTMQFVAPWMAYQAPMQGRPVVHWYLKEHGESLSRGAREWLAAQQQSWMSIWEVIEVNPGNGFTLRDLLTSEERLVHEVSGSRIAKPRHALLARVVDAGEISVICGAHPRPLPPRAAQSVVDRVRSRLRTKHVISPDLLREPKTATRILEAWNEAILDQSQRLKRPPRLQNTDGDELLLTTDRYRFDPAARQEIEARIGALDGVIDEGEEPRRSFAFVRAGNRLHKHWESTTIGHLEVGEGEISIETNSVERADALRSRVEEACSGLLTAHVRAHTDPLAMMSRTDDDHAATRKRRPTPEESAIIRGEKESHYEAWLDDPIPMLGGKTPREAARTKRGHHDLDLLLKEIELHESYDDEAARFDVRRLREALGIH